MARHAIAGASLCACLLGAIVPCSRAEDAPPAPSRTAVGAERRLPASLPVRAEPSPAGLTWPPALAWLGMAGAAGGLWWWLRAGARSLRGRSVANGQGIVRLSSQALTPHASVHALRWNGEDYLLACTSQQVTLVSRRPVATLEDA